jgi:hypothetical protein
MMTDQELKDLVASLAIAQAENSRGFAEIRAAQAENSRGFAEVRAAQAKTDEQLSRTERTIAVLADKIDKTHNEIHTLGKAQQYADSVVNDLKLNLKETRGEVYGVGKSQGAVTEEFFYNSLVDRLDIGGVQYDQILLNMNSRLMSSRQRKDHFECDIALINGKSIALIEVKYNVQAKAVAQVENHIRRFKSFFPQYSSHVLYGGIAGFCISDEVAELAHEKGFFVLRRKGEIVEEDTHGMKGY